MKPTKAELIERHEQLLKLDDVLTKHEKSKHFNMEVVGNTTACGTNHCLCGFAGMQPWFRERGLVTIVSPCADGIGLSKSHELATQYDDDDVNWNVFFGEDAYNEIFHHDFPNDWPAAMQRVRDRLERIKAMPEEQA